MTATKNPGPAICCFIALLAVSIGQIAWAEDKVETGKAIFEERCHRCHAQPDPAKPPPVGWEKKLEKMAVFAQLKPDQKEDVLAFLLRHSQDESIKETVSDDQKLLKEKCTVCHTLGRIALEKFDGEVGKHILDRMQSYAGKNNISNEDLQRILAYLQGNKDLPKPERVQTTDPAELFRTRCTACHSLERVFLKVRSGETTEATWTHIVARMRSKAPDWITSDESKELLSYLKTLSEQEKGQ